MVERRVFAHMVTRNEEHRYLETVLTALRPHVHTIHVYDDCSVDATVIVAQALGAVVTSRPPGLPSFADGEGLIRQAAWHDFEQRCGPCPGDWVLAVDADEVLVAQDGLWPSIDAAVAGACVAVSVPIPEVFAFADSAPMVRTDGFWPHQESPRLFAYQPGGRFRPSLLASGSVPTYAAEGPQSQEVPVVLLHLGYVDPEDRAEKFRRYAGQPGHSRSHINSILARPTLMLWPGPAVDVWRGLRG